MTENEKKQISELRASGLGYKKIAALLSLNPNTVKSHIRKIEKDTTIPKCPYCGKPLLNMKRKTDRFCSADCRKRWWSKNRYSSTTETITTQTCLKCGKPFRAIATAKRKYCSRQCYMEARFHEQETVS